MALEHIFAAIREEGEAELAAIRVECDEIVRAIEERARADAERAVQEALDADAERTRAAVRRIEGAATEDAERVRGAAREQVYSGLLTRVQERLAGSRSAADWVPRLRTLVGEARTALPDATEARLHPDDVAPLAGALHGLSVRGDLDGWGGVVLRAPDGRSVDNTLEARLQTAAPTLRRVAHERIAALRRTS